MYIKSVVHQHFVTIHAKNGCPPTFCYHTCKKWLSINTLLSYMQKMVVKQQLPYMQKMVVKQHSVTIHAKNGCPPPLCYHTCKKWLSTNTLLPYMQNMVVHHHSVTRHAKNGCPPTVIIHAKNSSPPTLCYHTLLLDIQNMVFHQCSFSIYAKMVVHQHTVTIHAKNVCPPTVTIHAKKWLSTNTPLQDVEKMVVHQCSVIVYAKMVVHQQAVNTIHAKNGCLPTLLLDMQKMIAHQHCYYTVLQKWLSTSTTLPYSHAKMVVHQTCKKCCPTLCNQTCKNGFKTLYSAAFSLFSHDLYYSAVDAQAGATYQSVEFLLVSTSLTL